LMNLLLLIIGHSHSSFLFQLLREKHGLTYTQGCSECYFKNHGFIYIRFKSDLKNVKKIIELIWNSLKKFKIKEKELHTAKEVYINNYNMEKENLLNWIHRMEEDWILNKKISRIENIKKINVKELQNIFHRVFIKENIDIYSIGDYQEIPSIRII